MSRNVYFIFIVLLCAAPAIGQSGGSYELRQSVTVTGGAVSGGTYSMVFTAGQPVAATIAGAPFVGNIGFWVPDSFAPTAATVSVSGRVTTASSHGVRNVVLKLVDTAGRELTARTSTFGFYTFSGIRTGETYILTIKSRRFVFNEPTRVLTINDDVTDVDFISVEESIER